MVEFVAGPLIGDLRSEEALAIDNLAVHCAAAI